MDKAKRLVDALREMGKTVATAESCTGGLIGKRITDVPGSSNVYPGGVISYSCEIKRRVLGVDPAVLETQGAVCETVAAQMAEGVRTLMGSDYGLSSTGVAGPDSDDFGNPVGLVYLGLTDGVHTKVLELHLTGDRASIRRKAAERALSTLFDLI
ncbi:MAG: CinA family protein [Oscillospiraceae bacterium]|nr:CinA family protein [Oscillospiraceae bacterium]